MSPRTEDGCQCGAYGAGVNGYHSRGAPLCSWTKLEESLKKPARPSPLCKCGHALNRHSIADQYEGSCVVAGCPCESFDRAPVVDSAPLAEPCAGCQKVARHPGEGYECMLHLRRVDPTQLAQPTGRRASAIACIYIAGPFSGSDGWEIKCNVHRAEELARQVAQLGAMPMTPHSIGAHMAGTESQTFWLAATLEMMRRCDAVLFTDDWRRSAGARGEMAEAARLEMPVFYSVASLKRWLEGGNAPAMVAAIGKRDGGA